MPTNFTIPSSGSVEASHFLQFAQPINQLESGQTFFVALAGGPSSYTATPLPAWSAYENGMLLHAKPNQNNSGSATLSVSGLSAVPIYRDGGSALNPSDLRLGTFAALIYRDGAFYLVNVGHLHETSDFTAGILPVANGGTGFGGYGQDELLMGTATGELTRVSGTGLGPVLVADSSQTAGARLGLPPEYLAYQQPSYTLGTQALSSSTWQNRVTTLIGKHALGKLWVQADFALLPASGNSNVAGKARLVLSREGVDTYVPGIDGFAVKSSYSPSGPPAQYQHAFVVSSLAAGMYNVSLQFKLDGAAVFDVVLTSAPQGSVKPEPLTFLEID